MLTRPLKTGGWALTWDITVVSYFCIEKNVDTILVPPKVTILTLANCGTYGGWKLSVRAFSGGIPEGDQTDILLKGGRKLRKVWRERERRRREVLKGERLT